MKRFFVFLAVCCFFPACMDPVEPEGTAQYENPDYPSDLFGYTPAPTTISDIFCTSGRVYLVDRGTQSLISFRADDPNLTLPDSLVPSDTLSLGFSPGKAVFDQSSDVLFLTDRVTNFVYRLDDITSGSPELISSSEFIVTDLFPVDQGSSLLVCFLGPEWLVRKLNAETGEIEGEYSTDWPITRAALSVGEDHLLLSNSGLNYLIEIDAATLQRTDSIPLPERPGPFLYNSSGNIVLFNQYVIHPVIYLFDGESGELLNKMESINSYKTCSLLPGTNTVLAPRRSDSRISVLNTETMIFAPSLFCFSYAERAIATPDGQLIVVFSDNPGRVYIFFNQ